MLNIEAKKPAVVLILGRLFLGMTLLFVLASGLDALIGFLLHYLLPQRKNMQGV